MRVYIQVKCVTCSYHNAVQAWHEEEKENDISNHLLPCAAPAHAYTTFRYGTQPRGARCVRACAMRPKQTLQPPRRAMQPPTQPHHSHTLSTMQTVPDLFLLYSCVWRRAAAYLPHDCLALNLSCSQVMSHTRWARSVRHADSRQLLHHDATRASTCMSQPSRSVPLTT